MKGQATVESKVVGGTVPKVYPGVEKGLNSVMDRILAGFPSLTRLR
jgi:hypothetical protein